MTICSNCSCGSVALMACIPFISRLGKWRFYSRWNFRNGKRSGQYKSQQQLTMKSKNKIILHDHNHDGLDRRGFLECMAWAGTGMLWTVSGGLLGSALLPSHADAAEMARGSFSFVQISDSHIGFNKEGVNTDVAATLKAAIARINALPSPPDFILHTGDLT